MTMIDLTNSELFKDLTSLEKESNFYDLHNNYACTKLDYDQDSKSLKFFFESIDKKSDSNVCLIFNEASIAKLNFFFQRDDDSKTVNNFYRGRVEIDGILSEYSLLGERYFYIEFENGNTLEIFAKEVVFM